MKLIQYTSVAFLMVASTQVWAHNTTHERLSIKSSQEGRSLINVPCRAGHRPGHAGICREIWRPKPPKRPRPIRPRG